MNRRIILDNPSRRMNIFECRSYSTSGMEPPQENKDWLADTTKEHPSEEEAASHSFLTHLVPDHEDRLRFAYILFLQVIHLIRSQDLVEEAIEFVSLLECDNGAVPPTSDIGRARLVVAIMIHAMVNIISSIPLSSPVREKSPDVFNMNGALVILSDSHLGAPEISLEDWNEFCMRAHPFLVGLGEKLDEGQLGPLDLEEILEVYLAKLAEEKP
ncbi:hypothetical protein BDZ97DRAFT_1926928 [Flammula alnicola]|nr:hypothetical protein BDZ97DRAFT_1926928 [Flammula alnicola]